MTAKAKSTSLRNITLAMVLCVAGAASTAFGQANSTPTTGRLHTGTLVAAATPAKAPGAVSAADDSSAAKADTAALMEEELSELRGVLDAQSAQLKEQQRRIQALEDELKTSNAPEARSLAPSGPNAPNADAAKLTAGVVSSPAAMPGTPLAAAPQAQGGADVAKQIDDRVKQIGPFTFSGDFRLRDEPFFGGPSNNSQVRDRLRYRGRLNFNTRLNSDFAGGFSLATGDINQPITANQDANQEFTRKPFYLDKAFILYTPHQVKQLSIVGGKFAYPWMRTELTWDNDLNPEGVVETLNFALPKTPVLKRVNFSAMQLPFAEIAGVNGNIVDPNNQGIVQSMMYGGQALTEWQLANWLKFTATASFYDYHKADPVAFSLQVANSASPAIGLLKLNPGSVQDSMTIWKNAAGTVVNAQFNSQFALLDSIARFDVKTPSAKWPLIVLGDYVQNTKACANAVNFFAPAGSTASTTATCNSRERRGYWLESRFGRLTDQHDLQIAYTRMFIEREAIFGAFNFDDMRQTSNVTEHRLEVFYNAYKNIRLQFTGLFGRPLNWGTPGTPPERTLSRLQIDVLYTF